MIVRIILRPFHRSFAWLSQNILSRVLVKDFQVGKYRTMPAMKYRAAVYEAVDAHSCSLCLHAKDFTFRYADKGRGREDGRRIQSLAFPPLNVIVGRAVMVWYC